MYHNMITVPVIQYYYFSSNILVSSSQDSSSQQSPPIKEQKTTHKVTHEIDVKEMVMWPIDIISNEL